MAKKQELKTVIVKGIITATSNKKGDFDNDPRKTLYFETTDKESLETLEKEGLTEYTSEDGNKFFIIKMSETTTVWKGEEELKTLNTSATSKNLESAKEVKIAFLMGYSEKYKTNYTRVFAISVEDENDLIVKEKENPFA